MAGSMPGAREGRVVQSFRDLEVWKLSMELTVLVYSLTRAFPKEELFGITSQLRRAAISIPSNVAEGQGRMSTREFRQFLSIARGSNCELQTQLEIAGRLGIGDQKSIEETVAMSARVGQMLSKLLSVLKAKLVD